MKPGREQIIDLWEWVSSYPDCPIKASPDGGLMFFLANDYGIVIRPGGRIEVDAPDDYTFNDVTLLRDSVYERDYHPELSRADLRGDLQERLDDSDDPSDS